MCLDCLTCAAAGRDDRAGLLGQEDAVRQEPGAPDCLTCVLYLALTVLYVS